MNSHGVHFLLIYSFILNNLSKYIDLTEEEFSAIFLHNEPWLTNTCQFQHCPLSTVIQYADYWSCMYLEDRG